MNEGSIWTEFDRATRLILEDDSTTVMEATDLLKNAHVIEMRSLAKINGEMIEMQRKRIAELEQLNCELNFIRRVLEDRVKESEQKLRAEQEHSKQLVAACRSCKKVQELEAEVISLQTVADCSNCGTVQELEKRILGYEDYAKALDKILGKEIQRAGHVESLTEHLIYEVDSLKKDLSIAKEGNKRYRAQLSQRNGLLPADKAIK